MRCKVHYREWLATQNVLDSMREADLREEGRTNIPTRDKHPAYGGYPRSEDTDPKNGNATPGPSGPRGEMGQNCPRTHSDQDSERRSNHYLRNCLSRRQAPGDYQMNKDPSDPDESDDESSLDDSYWPNRSTSGMGTQSPSSEDESKGDRRDRRTPGRRMGQARGSPHGPSGPTDPSSDGHGS